ncbi:MAG: MFS transporter [Streptosporangiales bacterium]|nr:MFS transporter [Streptosporangiales bacterium]
MTTTDPLAPSLSSPADGKTRGYAWLVTAMLVILMLINWADKSVLGLAAVPVTKEFGLSSTQYGFVASSFFFLFSIASVLVGLLALRIRTRWILLAIGVLWAVFQLPVLFGLGITGLLVSRIGLGAAEGPTSGLVVHTAHDWFPPLRRGLPTALTQIGGGIGLAAAAPVLTYLIVHDGWRSAFLALSAVGLAWAVVWALISREGPYAPARAARKRTGAPGADDRTEPRVAMWRILARPSWWGSLVPAFAAYWALSLMTAWLPAFMEKDLGFTLTATGTLLIIPPMVGMVSQLGFTMLSDRLVRRGARSRRARGLMLAAISLVSGVCVIAFPFAGSRWLVIVLLAIGLGVSNATFPIGQLVAAEISPARRRTASLGWAVGLSTCAGLIAPAITGYLVGAASTPHEGYLIAWTVAGALLIVGAVFAAFAVDPARDARRLGVTPAVPAS